MNIILFNFGKNHLYFQDCIDQILKYNNAKIHFIGNEDIFTKGANFINIDEFENESLIKEFKNISFYENDGNPLWRTSMARFFYIESLIKKMNLTDIFHFDNDVMIYDNFNKILINKKSSDENIITPTNEFNLTCGMMYIKDNDAILKLNQKLFEKLKLGVNSIYNNYPNRGSSIDPFMVNEMTILKIIQEENESLLSLFPILPTDINFNQYNICFDPASWGQHIGGTNCGHGPGWAGEHHYIGREILKNTYKALFQNGKPEVLDLKLNKKYPIFNLHIHSKNLNTFLS
jgi:hypothetical protein